jgi:glycosyltransferase involved in cell wall biosynthesis
MPKYLKSCDIFIRPSLSEGLGNSFIEAMAAELPVIATPVGGIVDFLFDPTLPLVSSGLCGASDQTGYFCKPANPESIKDTVNHALNNAQKNEVIQNAKKRAIEKYDWASIAMQMKGIVDNLAK